MPKIPTTIRLWLHATCKWSCHRWAVVDSTLQTLRVKPSLAILKKLITSDATVGSYLKMGCGSAIVPTWASRANFNVRVCLLTSRMADSATPLVACSSTGFLAKPTRHTGLPTRLQFSELQLMALHQFAILLGDSQVDTKDTGHVVAYSLFQFSRLWHPGRAICCQQIRRFHCAIKLQVSVMHRSERVNVDQTSDSTCSRVCVASSSMLSASRCNMMFDCSKRNNMWSLKSRSLHQQCLYQQSRFHQACAFRCSRGTRHWPNLHLLRWRLRKRAALNFSHVRHRTFPSEGAKVPRLLSRTHQTKVLGCFASACVDDF